MKAKTIVTAALLVFVVLSVIRLVVQETRRQEQEPLDAPQAEEQAPPHAETLPEVVSAPEVVPVPAASAAGDIEAREPELIVYYFIGNKRCSSCHKIEAYTKEALERAFASELRGGAIQWRLVNVELRQNEHYVQDFQLYGKSIVLARRDAESVVRKRNLADIWDLLGDKPAFQAYIEREVRAMMAAEGTVSADD